MRKIGFFGDTDFIMLQKMDKKGKAKPIQAQVKKSKDEEQYKMVEAAGAKLMMAIIGIIAYFEAGM